MYQIIQSAKVVKCDETGSLGIVVGNEVMPVGGLPFGDVKITEEVVQPECHPELVANEDIFNHFYIDGVASITVGETYIVNWNGVDYRCVAKAPDMVSYGVDPVYAILGNIAKIEETGDTGEPFVIRVGRYDNRELSEYKVYGFDGSTELTLSILQETENIHKLSGKYVEGMGWSEKTKKVVLPETFVAEHAQPVGGINGYIINSVLDSEKKYTVIYNGVAYDVISFTFDESIVAMGNAALMGSGTDTGEPFVIAHYTDTGVTAVGALDGDGITIAIYECEVETVHPIDKKYLQGINLRVFITVDENDEYVASHTYEEIKNHVLSGGTCDCVYDIYILRLNKAAFMPVVATVYRAPIGIEFVGYDGGTIHIVNITQEDVVTISSRSLSFEET